MYQELRSTGAWSYAKVEQMFEEHQGKWPEAIFNEDAWYKYLAPLVEKGSAAYISMLQGSKAEQRKWWMYNRFRYIDSKYNAGDALTDVITLRGYAKDNITVTPYADIYATVKYGSYLVQTRAQRNQAYTLINPLDSVNDTECYIYSASQLASIGDISGLKVGYAEFAHAIRLQDLKIGDASPSYSNGNLKELYLGNNVLLKKIDVRNCPNLAQAVDLSGCSNIEEAYFDGTSITGLSLPVGGFLKKLHVPGTVASLVIRNHKTLTELVMPSYSSLTSLRLENIGTTVNSKSILMSMTASARVRLIGFYWEAADATEIDAIFDKFDLMRGLDEYGNNTEKAQLSGTIHTASLTGAQIAAYNARYQDVAVIADHTTSYLTFANYDGTDTIATNECYDGVMQGTAPAGPARAATEQYEYSFVGWSKTMDAETADADALTDVIADRTVYAAYSKAVQTYTITWKNADNTVLETDTDVPYGATPSYDGSTPTYDGQTSIGWTPTPATVTGNATYTASYVVMHTATFVLASADGGTTLYTQDFEDGTVPTYGGSTPVSSRGTDYTFTGWTPALAAIHADTTYTAVFREPSEAPTATTADGAYGVEWDYSQNTSALTRKGLAASFTDPAPAESLTAVGSSPFDNIMPWSGMKRYNIIDGAVSYSEDDAGFSQTDYDTVVYIPEFYYTAYKDTDNQKWLWAISPTAKEGYKKHPGSGRYVGRYHTSGGSSAVYSKSGVAPLANLSQINFREYSHNKGSNWYMLDIASWSALQMLYLVEFANWDSQSMLGTGQDSGAVMNVGGTDSAAYHTLKISKNHNQYRWIEDPFSNVRDWIDGFFGGTASTYIGTDNASFDASYSHLTLTGIKLPLNNCIRGFGYSDKCAWAFIPDTAVSNNNYNTYVCDGVFAPSSSGSRYPAYVGGYCSTHAVCGFFYFYANSAASYSSASLGSRLLFT